MEITNVILPPTQELAEDKSIETINEPSAEVSLGLANAEQPSSEPSPENSESPLNKPKLGVNAMKKIAKEETAANFDSQKFTRLKFLLERSTIYSKFLSEKLDSLQTEKKEACTLKEKTSKRAGGKVGGANKKPRKNSKKPVEQEAEENGIPSGQPILLSGAILRDYQIDGVQWLISLYENGLNGILADEMGLGKTIQTIGFLSHLVEQGIKGPFLVVVPLSTLSNWMAEFERFAPSLTVVMYYGTKAERVIIRKRHFRGNGPDFMVTVTSYEVAMKDRSFFQTFTWKYLVVDEGHRLKNFNCKLSRELKKIGALNRLLLTGTPLHNNLAELWALLNFILPDIFDDLDSFIDWFDISDIGDSAAIADGFDPEEKKSMVMQLHQILKPFLLRRLKVDVEKSLPKKREYILNAHLTAEQQRLYEATLSGKLREIIIEDRLKEVESEAPVPPTLKTRYKYINNGDDIEEIIEEVAFDPLKAATKSVNNMHLQSAFMQLRKVCNHPLMFNPPYNKETGEYIYDPKTIVNSSGKMLLLDKLLRELIAKDHRILIFSQFTQIIDIIETYLLDLKKWEFCRIDGTVNQDSRQQQIRDFNSNTNIKIFLISTRAGGLGINLATADTVIFYDSDWNPQSDLQAQDRCHRIGQKKPVIVYRLITENTVESHLIGRANSKRMLEKLVIHKSKFKSHRSNGLSGFDEDFSNELSQMIYNKDYEQIIVKPGDELISQSDLSRIMDRSEEAYVQALELLKIAKEKGSNSAGAAAGFRLFETTQSEENQFSLQDNAAISSLDDA